MSERGQPSGTWRLDDPDVPVALSIVQMWLDRPAREGWLSNQMLAEIPWYSGDADHLRSLPVPVTGLEFTADPVLSADNSELATELYGQWSGLARSLLSELGYVASGSNAFRRSGGGLSETVRLIPTERQAVRGGGYRAMVRFRLRDRTGSAELDPANFVDSIGHGALDVSSDGRFRRGLVGLSWTTDPSCRDESALARWADQIRTGSTIVDELRARRVHVDRFNGVMIVRGAYVQQLVKRWSQTDGRPH